MTQFRMGQKVTDRDGYCGVIIKVTEWRGSTWYDIRFLDGHRVIGEAVRYDSDLELRT